MLITVHQRGLSRSDNPPSIKLDSIKKGEKLSFKKSPGSSISDILIECYYQGERVALVAESVPMSIPGTTVLNQEVYDSLPNEFTGKVSSAQKKTGKTTEVLLSVQLDLDGTESTSAEDKKFRFKICGGTTEFPAKTTVTADYNADKDKVFVTVKLGEKKGQTRIVTEYSGVPAGRVDEKENSGCSSLDDLELLKTVLASNEEGFEAKVDEASGNAYYVLVNVSGDILAEKETEMVKNKIGDIRQELIDKGYDEERITNIEDYLLASGFDAEKVIEIFKSYRPLVVNYDDLNEKIAKLEVLKKEKDSESDTEKIAEIEADIEDLETEISELKEKKAKEEEMNEIVKAHIIKEPATKFNDDKEEQLLLTAYSAIKNKFHILCSGEKGTGKNVFVETVAWIYQRPLFSISINSETDKLDLIGSKTIDAEEKDAGIVQKVEFSPEVLLTAMEVGGIMNIDEINFADPGITALLHSVADDRRSLQVPGYKFVSGDENFVIMGTMNLDYQGTSELNEALADRFIDIVFPNKDSIYDVLVEKCPGIRKDVIKSADKIYSDIIEKYRNADASFDSSCITVRGYIQAVKMSEDIGIKKALTTCVANKIRDNEYRQAVEAIISLYV